MARLCDQDLDVGVVDVVGQVLPAAGVVESDDARPDESGSADRHHIVRGVVQQYAYVRRPVRPHPSLEHQGELHARVVELAVSHHEVAELEGRPACYLGILGVLPQKRPCVVRRQRRLTRWRCGCETPFHLRRHRRVRLSRPWYCRPSAAPSMTTASG